MLDHSTKPIKPSHSMFYLRLISCLFLTDDSFRTRSTSNIGNAAFPSSSPLATSSRNSVNSVDQKNNGNKDSQSRKMSL